MSKRDTGSTTSADTEPETLEAQAPPGVAEAQAPEEQLSRLRSAARTPASRTGTT